MAPLSLTQLFIVIFLLIFVVILLYVACRRIYEIVATPQAELVEKIRKRTQSNSSNNTANNSFSGGIGGSSISGHRISQTSNHSNNNNPQLTISSLPGLHRAHTIVVRPGEASSVSTTGGPLPASSASSVYTIPISSLDLSRTSVVIIQRPPTSVTPQIVVEEPPPSYEDCVSSGVRGSDPGDIV